VVVVIVGSVVIVVGWFALLEPALTRNTNSVLPMVLTFFCFMIFFQETYNEFYQYKSCLYETVDFLFKKVGGLDKKNSELVQKISSAYIGMGAIYCI
jgi:hypothetical protein